MKEIITKAFDELGLKKYEFESHDAKILFGDLNF